MNFHIFKLLSELTGKLVYTADACILMLVYILGNSINLYLFVRKHTMYQNCKLLPQTTWQCMHGAINSTVTYTMSYNIVRHCLGDFYNDLED